MGRRVICCFFILLCVVSDVAAQEITREKETKSHDYVPMNYLAVMEQLNRAWDVLSLKLQCYYSKGLQV